MIRFEIGLYVLPQAWVRQFPLEETESADVPPRVVDSDEVCVHVIKGDEQRRVVESRFGHVPAGQVIEQLQQYVRIVSDEVIEDEQSIVYPVDITRNLRFLVSSRASLDDITNALFVTCAMTCICAASLRMISTSV
jgi:hypothetical protein